MSRSSSARPFTRLKSQQPIHVNSQPQHAAYFLRFMSTAPPTKRAGVWVDGIEHAAIQRGLFDSVDRDRQNRLLQALDSVTHKMGRDSLRLASQEHVESIVSSKLRSPSYSTKLSDILESNRSVGKEYAPSSFDTPEATKNKAFKHQSRYFPLQSIIFSASQRSSALTHWKKSSPIRAI